MILVDNGRSDIIANEDFRQSLNCIRCGACINTCPVYRRSGGHSYGYTIRGPIGSTLGASKDLRANKTLPFACTLCASCSNVCPLKINLHNQLYKHRQNVVKAGLLGFKKYTALKVATWVMKHPALMDFSGKMARKIVPKLPRSILYSKANAWGKKRELPKFPQKSFKELYKERKK